MSESLLKMGDLIKLYIQKGEIERSKEQAEEVIRSNPEHYAGYILMAYHCYLLGQSEDAVTWIKEALQRAPEDEGALEIVIVMYQGLQSNELKTRELIETGLRLYPENHFFHAQYAEINKTINIEQSLASYQEAIRLSPQNDEYLGEYAILLYQTGNLQDAEKYEQLALQANPENSVNLLNFAWVAYQRKKYKKAQWLIDQAMRLEPNNVMIREYYKKIYPTKNVFIRAKLEINQVLFKIWAFPTNFIWKLFKGNVPIELLGFVVIALELGGLYALLRNNLFIIIGAYFVLLITSSILAKSMLKKVGFTDVEETAMKKKTELSQKAALKEMKKGIAKNNDQLKREQTPLSRNELEAQLSQIWSSANIAEIKEKSEVKEATPEKAIAQTNPPAQKAQTTFEWPEEYSKWPIYMMMIGIILSFMVRFVPEMLDDSNRPIPVSPEVQESAREVQEQLQLDRDAEIVKENMQVVAQFVQSVKEGNLTDTAPQFVIEGYEPVIQNNIDHPLLKQLANAKIKKVITPHTGLPISHFLLVNEDENVKAIVELTSGQITHLYAESWNQTEEETADYEELMERIEHDGKDLEEILKS